MIRHVLFFRAVGSGRRMCLCFIDSLSLSLSLTVIMAGQSLISQSHPAGKLATIGTTPMEGTNRAVEPGVWSS